MRRLIAMVAAVFIAPVLVTATTSTAQAAAGDPVAALRGQFVKKSGVRLVEDTRLNLDGKTVMSFREAGVLRFGPSGVTAADMTAAEEKGVGGGFKSRTITIGKSVYVKSPAYADLLPEGKSWVRSDRFDNTVTGGLIDILSPGVLKAVLATTKSKVPGGTLDGTRTVVYRGTITLTQLAKVVPAIRTFAKKVKKPVGLPWKLWVGGDLLPRRFSSSILLSSSPISGDSTMVVDSRFKDWGTKVVVKAPPAAEVIDFKDVDQDLPETEPHFVEN